MLKINLRRVKQTLFHVFAIKSKLSKNISLTCVYIKAAFHLATKTDLKIIKDRIASASFTLLSFLVARRYTTASIQ